MYAIIATYTFLKKKINVAVNLFKKHGRILRTSETEELGIHNRTLYKMLEEGYITKLERGVYKLADTEMLFNPDLVVVAKKIPKATICLISALSFHKMTAEIPYGIHIAIPRTNRDSKLDHPPINVYRFSGKSLTEGVQSHKVEGVEVQVYNPAKTIGDCLKFRNKIGLDIVMEALQQGIK